MAAVYGAFMPIYAISVRQRDASQYITADYINLSINTLPIKTIPQVYLTFPQCRDIMMSTQGKSFPEFLLTKG